MNRRGFLTSMLKAGVAAAFLPGAGRLWKRTEQLWIPNPEWVTAEYRVQWLGDPFFGGRVDELLTDNTIEWCWSRLLKWEPVDNAPPGCVS